MGGCQTHKISRMTAVEIAELFPGGFDAMPRALMEMFVASKGGKRLMNVIGGEPTVY